MFNSWTTLSTYLAGNWRLYAFPDRPFTFSIATIDYNALVAPAPVVTPAHNAVVTSPFVITSTPQGSGYELRGSGVRDVDVDGPGDGSLVISYSSAAPGATIRFTGQGPEQSIDQFVSAVASPPQYPNLQFQVRLTFERSTQVTFRPVNAVPEPSAFAVAAIGVCAILLGSRRQKPAS
jgi:hypothetical protein